MGYLTREASALYLQGSEFGDNRALRSAFERRTRLIELNPRKRAGVSGILTRRRVGGASAIRNLPDLCFGR
jgi:hypothetical protein